MENLYLIFQKQVNHSYLIINTVIELKTIPVIGHLTGIFSKQSHKTKTWTLSEFSYKIVKI